MPCLLARFYLVGWCAPMIMLRAHVVVGVGRAGREARFGPADRLAGWLSAHLFSLRHSCVLKTNVSGFILCARASGRFCPREHLRWDGVGVQFIEGQVCGRVLSAPLALTQRLRLPVALRVALALNTDTERLNSHAN
jgi:hypothetical protein